MKISAKRLYEEGWHHELLRCPHCGGLSVYSRIGPNGYSQFICINPDCDFKYGDEEE